MWIQSRMTAAHMGQHPLRSDSRFLRFARRAKLRLFHHLFHNNNIAVWAHLLEVAHLLRNYYFLQIRRLMFPDISIPRATKNWSVFSSIPQVRAAPRSCAQSLQGATNFSFPFDLRERGAH